MFYKCKQISIKIFELIKTHKLYDQIANSLANMPYSTKLIDKTSLI